MATTNRQGWAKASARFTGPDGGRPNAEEHFRKHVIAQSEWDDAPATTEAYVTAAAEHLNSETEFAFYDPIGDSVVKYDLDRNELGIARRRGGHIRTYFRPTSGGRYVLRQLRDRRWFDLSLADQRLEAAPEADDAIAVEVGDYLRGELEEIVPCEASAVLAVRDWLSRADADLAPVVELLWRTAALRIALRAAQLGWQSTETERVVREIEPNIVDRVGAAEGLVLLLGEALDAAVEAMASHEIDVFETSIRVAFVDDDTWDRRDRLEVLVSCLAAASLRRPQAAERYRSLRVRCAALDVQLRPLFELEPPEGRIWEPLAGLWWRVPIEVHEEAVVEEDVDWMTVPVSTTPSSVRPPLVRPPPALPPPSVVSIAPAPAVRSSTPRPPQPPAEQRPPVVVPLHASALTAPLPRDGGPSTAGARESGGGRPDSRAPALPPMLVPGGRGATQSSVASPPKAPPSGASSYSMGVAGADSQDMVRPPAAGLRALGLVAVAVAALSAVGLVAAVLWTRTQNSRASQPEDRPGEEMRQGVPDACVTAVRPALADYPQCARWLFEDSNGDCVPQFHGWREDQPSAAAARGYCAHLAAERDQ